MADTTAPTTSTSPDYTPLLERIAISLESLATEMVSISTELKTMNEATTSISDNIAKSLDKTDKIANGITQLASLASSTGIVNRTAEDQIPIDAKTQRAITMAALKGQSGISGVENELKSPTVLKDSVSKVIPVSSNK